MMGQPKPFASLSSGLLARKGQAKPAMRPQGFSGFGAVSEAIDDLGWNDMGHNDSQPGPAPAEPLPLPPVLRQREALSQEIEAAASAPEGVAPVLIQAASHSISPAVPMAMPRDVSSSTERSPKRRGGGGIAPPAGSSKAAFTLRLDADRHLRLRLASALHRQSAQQLVTEALDSFLKTLPEVEAMAYRLSTGADDDQSNGG
ncbi:MULTISPECIES: hypothetical protein [unclassified Sphingomonas]|uniref:hypothetical protein n=1 Tax=unclassified Sphingomonas TaxID=196159 RepID=UPI002699F4C9